LRNNHFSDHQLLKNPTPRKIKPMRKIPNSYTKTYSFHFGKLREEKTTEKTNQRDRSARPSGVLGVAGIPVKSADFLHFEFPNSSFSPSRLLSSAKRKPTKFS
jgi:hypothetical protein